MITFPGEFISRLKKAKSITVLTGAGVSKESGIPTFRDAQSGLWAKYNPEELASPDAFRRNPRLVWDFYKDRRTVAEKAIPNPGHFALAKMEKLFDTFSLITQNVDGLHARAGSSSVIELHGNLHRIKCSGRCAVVGQWVDEGLAAPRCQKCGAFLRVDVVWFGESLPAAELEKAMLASQNCDVFFSIGTSGVVQPAASLGLIARDRGAVFVEINYEPSAISRLADYKIYGESGTILPQLLQALL